MRLAMAMSILDVTDPTRPELVYQAEVPESRHVVGGGPRPRLGTVALGRDEREGTLRVRSVCVPHHPQQQARVARLIGRAPAARHHEAQVVGARGEHEVLEIGVGAAVIDGDRDRGDERERERDREQYARRRRSHRSRS